MTTCDEDSHYHVSQRLGYRYCPECGQQLLGDCPSDGTPCSVCSALRDTMAKMEYNHRYEREKMSRVIRRLVRYADRVAERHPKAVTIHGQNARVEGGMWLAEFDRQNDKTQQPT